MAMMFERANAPQMPNYVNAYIEEEKIKNQIRQAEQIRRMQYGVAGANFAEKVPEGAWGDLGNALTGGSQSAASPAGATMIEPASGAVASALPEAAMASDALLGAIPISSAAPSTALGMEAAGVAEASMAAEAASAAGAASPGAGAALSALGPMGWMALLGFGLAATDAFG